MRGGWVRNGITLDGGEEAEDSVVWWLQAPSKHCDLRLPFGGSDGLMAFAGTTSWAAPRLTWNPELELNPSIFEDVGVISWDGPDLMEAGVFYEDGREITYVERWQRLPGSEQDLLALRNDTGRIVRAGSYALSIIDDRPDDGAFAAVAWTLSENEWSIDHRWPADAVAPAPPLFIPPDTEAVVLDDGEEWIIDER
jgi:hypothetical protein